MPSTVTSREPDASRSTGETAPPRREAVRASSSPGHQLNFDDDLAPAKRVTARATNPDFASIKKRLGTRNEAYGGAGPMEAQNWQRWARHVDKGVLGAHYSFIVEHLREPEWPMEDEVRAHDEAMASALAGRDWRREEPEARALGTPRTP